jgi:hypothetical protein
MSQRPAPKPEVLHAQERQWAELNRWLMGKRRPNPPAGPGGSCTAVAESLEGIFHPAVATKLTSLSARPTVAAPTC